MAHRTPLRRVSRGSLAAISRSGNFPEAPHGLGFMGPALESLADEAEALHANLEGLNALAASLETFNESFSSYLFIQKVNVFCVEWFQAPVDESYELAEQRANARKAAAALEALRRAQAPPTSTAQSSNVEAERTMLGDATFALSEVQDTPAATRLGGKPKKKVKAKMTPKERKERGMILERVCSVLPLEFRGGDPTLRRQVEHVIESLMDAEGPLKITDMIRADINQAKVNKCLIPLVGRKVVRKVSNSGGVTYVWQGLP
ncbi:hypothetical protein BU17DRAFT_84994 [Hysterangium stoloniferum]|nr:hypothetical protein BU17DRAFT_84994 [Hysterangium stoloniferum]